MSLRQQTGSLLLLILGALPAVAVGIGFLLISISMVGPANRPTSGIADLGPGFAQIFLFITLPIGATILLLVGLSRLPIRPFLQIGIIGNIGIGVLFLVGALVSLVFLREAEAGMAIALPALLFLFTGFTAVYGWSLRGQLSPVYAQRIFWIAAFMLAALVLWQGIRAVVYQQGRLILPGHETHINSVAWSPNGQMVASGDRNGRLLLWHLDPHDEARNGYRILRETGTSIGAVAWSPDGQRLALDLDDEAILLTLGTGEEQTRFAHTDTINSIVWSPNGRLLALGSASKDVTVWDVATGEQQHHFHFDTGGIGQALAWSPDGQTLAYNIGGGYVVLWDTETGAEKQRWKLNARTGPLAWSPDSRQLAYHGISAVGILDVATGETVHTFAARNGNLESIAWSPNGDYVAAGSTEGTIRVWQTESGRLVQTVSEHDGIVWGLAWSPDSQKLVSGAGDAQLIVWSNID